MRRKTLGGSKKWCAAEARALSKRAFATSWFSADTANPSFAGVRSNLNFRKAGVGEELAMLVHAEAGHSGLWSIFFAKSRHRGVGSLVDFGDDEELALRFQDAEDFAQVSGQVGPPEVRFHRCDEVEHPVGKRQLRHRGVVNLDAVSFDPASVGSVAGGDARFGKVNSVDLSLCSHRGQLADGSAAATTYVEDRVALVDRHVRQAPVGNFGMPRIHVPQGQSAQPSSGFLALTHVRVPSDHGGAPSYSSYAKISRSISVARTVCSSISALSRSQVLSVSSVNCVLKPSHDVTSAPSGAGHANQIRNL